MKIRLEILDGPERVNVEFEGEQWKEYLMRFIESIGDKFPSTQPSSTNTPQKQSFTQQSFTQPAHQGQQPIQQNPQYYPPQYYPVPQGVFYYPQPAQYQPAMQPQQTFQPQNEPQQQTPMQMKESGEQLKLHERLNDTSLTINERLELFLKYEYPNVWFTSQDIQKHYEKVYGKIKLSTVSTYLSRMYRRKLLERRGNRTQREYKYINYEENSTFPEYPASSGILRI